MKQADGRLLGPGVDALECAMKALDQPYSLEAVSMARSNRLDAEGRDHIWFPTYDTGDPERAARLAGPIGWLAIQWFLPHGARLRPDMPGFKARARVTAFPGSHPEVLLRRGGFNLVPGTDDENRLVLWLVEGKVDAALSADFRETLKAGAADYARSLDIVPYTRLPVAFELTRGFAKHHPGFRPRFQAALDTCRARGIPAEE
ncbi:MAG: hypothetical protein EP335_00460 [Alphaproteobacteria bacterium]|nr:MAG: hypothetical protein EP335_00460 [Alphaproteobacteria bacterium]